jgi:hypothetical protein
MIKSCKNKFMRMSNLNGMKHSWILAMGLLLLLACKGNSGDAATTAPVEEVRKTVKTEPVASYSEALTETQNQKLNSFMFKADLFETEKTFVYKLKFEYEVQAETTTVEFPNLGYAPNPVLQKGSEPFSIIIGFKDDKGSFKELKKLYVDAEGNIGLRPLRKYGLKEVKAEQ